MTYSSPDDTPNARLCRLEDIPDGGAHEVTAHVAGEPESILLLRRGDDVRAFHNVCPHAGRSLNWAPGRFLLEDGLIICAAHGASFEIPGGRCVGGPCRGSELKSIPIQQVAGELMLNRPD